MIIDGDVIVVTSLQHFYSKEESGEKPYTVRIATQEEMAQIRYRKPHRVRIENKNRVKLVFFERTITSYDKLGELLGFVLVGIAWDPAEGRK